jgi:hypothetical protein
MSRKKAEEPVSESEPVAPVEEQRVQEPEAEVLSLSVAEEVGVLPAEDRRAPEPVAVDSVIEGGTEAPVLPALPAVAEAAPLIPNNAISVVVEGPDGTKRTALGSILE